MKRLGIKWTIDQLVCLPFPISFCVRGIMVAEGGEDEGGGDDGCVCVTFLFELFIGEQGLKDDGDKGEESL